MVKPFAIALGAGLLESMVGFYTRMPTSTLVLFLGITTAAIMVYAVLAPDRESPSSPFHRQLTAVDTRTQDLAILRSLVRDDLNAAQLVTLFEDIVARMSQGLLTTSDTDAYVHWLLDHEAGTPIPLSSAGLRVSDPPALSNHNYRFFAAGVSQVTRLLVRLVAEHDVCPEEIVRIILSYAQLRANEFGDGPFGIRLELNPEADFRWAEEQLAMIRDSMPVI